MDKGRLPPGPAEAFSSSGDLLGWLVALFALFGSIFEARIDGFRTYVVSDPAMAEHVLRTNWQNYEKGWSSRRIGFLLGNGLMTSEGELWQTQRRMIQPAFHERALGRFSDAIVSANEALRVRWMAAAQRGEAVNVTRDVSHLTLDIMLAVLFSDDAPEVLPPFRILSDETQRDLHFAQEFRRLRHVVGERIAARRAAPSQRPDILGMLLAARNRAGTPMSDEQLVSEIMTLIVAGHETTASALGWTWYLLATHPAVEEKLAHEIAGAAPALMKLDCFPYAQHVLGEVLRLYPPGWLLTRKALRDDRLGDYVVPAGTEIYISPYLIHRNPALWLAPERFDPDRFTPERARGRHPLAHIPFSAGPRNCVGEVLARSEMQIHLMVIARALRFEYTADRPPEIAAGVNLRSRHDLVMTPRLKTQELKV